MTMQTVMNATNGEDSTSIAILWRGRNKRVFNASILAHGTCEPRHRHRQKIVAKKDTCLFESVRECEKEK
jgi:hypothetical protein